MTKNLALLLLIAALGASAGACKKEEPSAAETLDEQLKDSLDLRENEKLKDAGESAAEALRQAGEAAKEAVTPEEMPAEEKPKEEKPN